MSALQDLALEMFQDAGGEIDPNCPYEEGPYHMWTCDGPFTVHCDNCGADGRITMTSGPEEG